MPIQLKKYRLRENLNMEVSVYRLNRSSSSSTEPCVNKHKDISLHIEFRSFLLAAPRQICTERTLYELLLNAFTRVTPHIIHSFIYRAPFASNSVPRVSIEQLHLFNTFSTQAAKVQQTPSHICCTSTRTQTFLPSHTHTYIYT